MTRVTVSPKFQIVIPKELRQKLRLRPGQKMTLLEREGILTAIPDLPPEKYRGIVKGMSPAGVREKKERI